MVRRRTAALLLLLLFLLLLPAAGLGETRVFDEAGLFTAEDISVLEERIDRIRNRYRMDAVVVTSSDVPSNASSFSDEESLKFADDFYDSRGFGLGEDKAGLLYLIDMHNRVSEISTCGVMIDYISDHRLEALYDAADPYLSKREYALAALAVLDRLEGFLKKGIEEGTFRYDRETGERLTGMYNALTRTELLLALAGGLGTAALIYLAVAAKYNLKRETYHFNKDVNSRVDLTRDEKTFDHQTVTRTRISSSSGSGRSGGSGGGGSGVHFSSSGVSHGGGGGHHF